MAVVDPQTGRLRSIHVPSPDVSAKQAPVHGHRYKLDELNPWLDSFDGLEPRFRYACAPSRVEHTQPAAVTDTLFSAVAALPARDDTSQLSNKYRDLRDLKVSGILPPRADAEPFPDFGVYGDDGPVDTTPDIEGKIREAMSLSITSPPEIRATFVKPVPIFTQKVPTIVASASSESISLDEPSTQERQDKETNKADDKSEDREWQQVDKEEAEDEDLFIVRPITPVQDEWQRDSEGMTRMRWDDEGNPIAPEISRSINSKR